MAPIGIFEPHAAPASVSLTNIQLIAGSAELISFAAGCGHVVPAVVELTCLASTSRSRLQYGRVTRSSPPESRSVVSAVLWQSAVLQPSAELARMAGMLHGAGG